MIRTFHILLSAAFLLATSALTGCSQNFYAPTNQQVLNFEEKGDVVVGGTIDSNEGFGGNAGYAITNHIAVSSVINFYEQEPQQKHRYDSYMWDNELIVFNKGKSQNEGHFIQAANLGYGFGEIGRNSTSLGTNINRLYIQPSIGYKVKGFEFATSLRLSSVKYDIRPAYAWNPDSHDETLEEYFNTPRDNTRYFFAEPALTFGYGFKGVKLRVQRSMAMAGFSDDFEYAHDNLAISLSVNLNAIRIFNKE